MLTYNKHHKHNASKLRQAGVLSEVLLWQQLQNRKLNGLNFRRQKRIGNYIVDFYCPSKNVIIEIDGCSHEDKGEYDAERDKYLEKLGLTIIHIQDHEIKQDLNEVMKFLENYLL